MNKFISEIMIAVMVLVALAAFAMPASASGDPGAGCPTDTKYHDTINGSIYLGFDPYASIDSSPRTMTFDNVPGGIKLAKIYTGFWQGSPSKGGNFNITIVNSSGSYTTPTYQSCDPCPGGPCSGNQSERCDALNWTENVPPNVQSGDIHGYITGCGVQFISFNATPYITPGTNTITVEGSGCENCTCWDGRIYAIALLVVYEDDLLPEITYWINEGAAYMEVGSGCDGTDDHTSASYYFNGTHISNPMVVSYEVLGWPHVFSSYKDSAYTKFNSINNIGAPDFELSQYYSHYVRYDNIGASNLVANNFMEYYDPGGFYERANVAWLVVKGNSTDLTVPDIEFPPAMRPDKNHTINATIKNCGNIPAGSFNVSLLIDGELNGTVSVSGLDGNTTTTVSFPVNLSYGCYEFKVVADCYGQVTEPEEYNNVTSKDQQVGYHIVVDGNDGFDDLLAEVGSTLPTGSVVNTSGTYYIQDLDIVNCAGPGIRIENTNVPFVISGCTVYDCGGDGGAIYLHNLVDGKINDCTVVDNERKGIRLKNCSHVEINNNLVQNNQEYGIDLFMEAMPTVDCEFINITCNTLIGNEYGIEMFGDNCIVRGNIIQNSRDYGIYMTGNNSKVYNNTIENSTGCGLKLDNAPTTPCFYNHIYWNDIIGNNGSGVQAYDSGTTNTWKTPEKVNYSYKGSSTWYNFTGNYWDNHRDPTNPDGIMDSPYPLVGGTSAQDSYPLSVEWRLCGDANRNGAVNTLDALAVRNYAIHGFSLCNSWAADVNCNGEVNTLDALAIRNYAIHGFSLNCCKDC